MEATTVAPPSGTLCPIVEQHTYGSSFQWIFADLRRERHRLKTRLRPRFATLSNDDLEDAISAAIELMLTRQLVFKSLDEMRAWLFTSSVYCLMNERRRVKKYMGLEEASSYASDEDCSRTLEQQSTLQAALTILNEADRELLLAKYTRGISIVEVATKRGTTVSSLHKRQQRALKRVRARMRSLR